MSFLFIITFCKSIDVLGSRMQTAVFFPAKEAESLRVKELPPTLELLEKAS